MIEEFPGAETLGETIVSGLVSDRKRAVYQIDRIRDKINPRR
jgi:hypothetical protein